jgi:hypothetical protein
MPSKRSLLAGTDDLDRPPGYPFRGPGLLVRVAPFAAIAALAEASLALASGSVPALAVAMSLVLLTDLAEKLVESSAAHPGHLWRRGTRSPPPRPRSARYAAPTARHGDRAHHWG